jgi:hypothetical protein
MTVMAAFTISVAVASTVNEIGTIGGSGSSGGGRSGGAGNADMNVMSAGGIVTGTAMEDDTSGHQTMHSQQEEDRSRPDRAPSKERNADPVRPLGQTTRACQSATRFALCGFGSQRKKL